MFFIIAEIYNFMNSNNFQVKLTLYSAGTWHGYLASLPNIKKYGENLVVNWRLVLKPNMTASKCLSQSWGLSLTNLDSALEKNEHVF